ncbi:DUF676-domain-containing protein [Rhodotorula sp. JG-1b]|nr:DUF676-domain-containing protein [Rhodotorula sp. JG-1b]
MAAARTNPVHLVTVLHGLWGAPQHVQYIVDAISNHAAAASNRHHSYTGAQPKVIVLAPSTNAESFAHTYDGIDECSVRVVQEIDAECARITTEDPSARIAKFSIVGYSLGGLIARYVIGVLDSRQPSFFRDVEPVHFATFASPAIGIPHYDTFWSGAFRFLGSRMLSRTGNQLYERDRFLPARFANPNPDPNSDDNAGLAGSSKKGGFAEPLLKIMADPRYSFYRALLKFKHIDVFANTVNDRTVPFPTGAIEAHDPFALARAKAKKVADKRGDDPDSVPDIREGGLETDSPLPFDSHLVKGTPLVRSYGPPAEPFEPANATSTESTDGRRKRGRFRLRLPLLLRPTTYPFSRPVSLLVICFLPIALPLTVGYLITRFALQGRESRRRIRDARKERGEGREGMLMRVGVRIGEIAEQVGGDNPEYAADLAVSEDEEEGRARATPPSSTDSTPPPHAAAASAPSASSRPAAAVDRRISAPSTQLAPTPSDSILEEARRLRTDPTLTASQQFQVDNLNAIPHLRKHFVYLPHARNAHGAIVRRDPSIAMHREGKKVIDAWVGGFEI